MRIEARTTAAAAACLCRVLTNSHIRTHTHSPCYDTQFSSAFSQWLAPKFNLIFSICGAQCFTIKTDMQAK